MKTVRLVVHAVPEDQHRKIKSAAAMQGVTLQQFVLSAAINSASIVLKSQAK